jgi:hypothetical protein
MKQQTLTGFERYGKTTRRAKFLADPDRIHFVGGDDRGGYELPGLIKSRAVLACVESPALRASSE